MFAIADSVVVGPGAERVAALVARMVGDSVDAVTVTPRPPAHPRAAVCLAPGTPEQARVRAAVYEGVRVACVYPVWEARIEEMVAAAEVEEGARAIGLTWGVPAVSQLGFMDGLLLDRAFVSTRYREAVELASVEDIRHWVGADPTAADALHVVAAAALARANGAEAEAIRAALRA